MYPQLKTSLYEEDVPYIELVFDGSNAHVALAFQFQQYTFPCEHACNIVSLVDAQVHPRIAENEQKINLTGV